ncbi:hypothetical protein ASPZODRAFT_134556 [Penicilliopsis zonata CBS 506.65]|uniref:Enoyl reductase (ER) domain-containing protein n=1 Tax=Penicilliopsis zonata CBS 506.65 TaxID=1073090 RepID=A0A1L9SD75_9EURO|nr:hypothetical protein ASPZODRAFT_134556 [Penicilliopsis zonata CBS 506.65]OJJ45131.1 hypothetical protein ASPZODRAFT_134556 [Penicilliopsis zonata CBS 506.65]
MVSFNVFRGSSEGRIVTDRISRSLGPNEAYVETTHSGLCGTDEHFLKAGLVLGHEGVGIVREVGSNVSSVRVGDRVGFGYTHSVCGDCTKCLTGWDQYCPEKKEYGTNDHDNGSFSEGAIWDAKCLVPIPAGYDSVNAAPMMCAGATVWTILSEYGVRATDRVGVMGVGGLGHLAIKLAAAKGCHVVVFSSSEAKREEAMGFGAAEYHVFKAGEKIEGLQPVNHLILCGSGGVDYTGLLPLLDTMGSVYPLTVDLKPTSIPLLAYTVRGIRIQGSLVASRQTLRSLMQFVAKHNITPTVMTFSLDEGGIEEAMKTLREGKMRYRGVLVKQN